MTQKHTPGPWSVNTWPRNDNHIAVGAEGSPVLAYALLRDVSINEQKANARLIAAAPDMKEALECSRAMDWLNCEGTGQEIREHALEVLEKYGFDRNGVITYQQFVCDKMDAAIAKAEGTL